MNAIELIITVCAVLSPNSCEERHLSFSADFGLQQCTMNAPPYPPASPASRVTGDAARWSALRVQVAHYRQVGCKRHSKFELKSSREMIDYVMSN